MIAKTLTLVFVLSLSMVYSPNTSYVDVVSAATGTETSTTPAKTTPKTTTVKKAPATSTVVNGGQVHVVVFGDTMAKIAKKYNVTLKQLLDLNPQVKNKNLIYVGQKINTGKAVTTPVATVSPKADNVKIYQGLGYNVVFRNGPGKDSEGVPVYSFTVVMADASFDAEGRILNAYIDAYEVSTPNYDGDSMPHFSGWPGKEGYNVTDHATEKVTGVSENTLESITAEVNGWKTKRERGDSYHMNPANEWYKQMDYFQKFFVGKTVAELQEWFAKSTTAAGRPIKETTTKQDELDKLAKLTPAERAELADVVSGATMSISDPHGDFLGAVVDAFNNRVEVVVPVK
jgi:LysM repeat protein